MEKKCEGCGTILQTTDNQAPGYVPDLSMDYCQRCFRMIHYDKHTETNVEPLVTLKALENVEGDFFWIIDVMDLETSLNSAFIDFYHNRECTIILNKCDLLPEAMTEEKLLNYICERIDELKINCNKIIIRGMGRHFLEDFAFIADTGNRMIFTLHFFLSIFYNLDIFLQFYVFPFFKICIYYFFTIFCFMRLFQTINAKIMTKIAFYIFIIFFFCISITIGYRTKFYIFI